MSVNNLQTKLQKLWLNCAGIVAVNQDGLIGVTEKETGKQVIPWSVPEDLAYFKHMTEGSILIMGRKTFESLPGPLKGRAHIVITHTPWDYSDIEKDPTTPVWFANYDTLPIYLEIAERRTTSRNVFIIGGSEIFSALCDVCSKLYITLIHTPTYRENAQYSKLHYFHPPLTMFQEKHKMIKCSPLHTSRGKDNLQYEFWEFGQVSFGSTKDKID